MIVTVSDDFDLGKIAESGQCFRWRKVGDGYKVPYGSRMLEIHPVKGYIGSYDVSCGPDGWNNYWAEYFDLQTDYRAIRNRIDREKDPYLFSAAEAGQGIRILRQDRWEMLITFIISQRKSIPAIRTCVEKLCTAAGERIDKTPDGRELNSFPGPAAVAALSGKQLSACGLGYRVKYIQEVSRLFSEKRMDVNAMESLGDSGLYRELIRLPGIGAKVADCVMLFGFHRLDVFPIDVWIKRVLQENYPDGFPYDQYSPYCGVMQQYLFYYRRTLPAASVR